MARKAKKAVAPHPYVMATPNDPSLDRFILPAGCVSPSGRKITFAAGGTLRITVDLSRVTIPDFWHMAMQMCDGTVEPAQQKIDGAAVLRLWDLAHDLLRHAQHQGK